MGRFNNGAAAGVQKLTAGEENSILDGTANDPDEFDTFEDPENQMELQDDPGNETEEQKEGRRYIDEAVAGKLRSVPEGCLMQSCCI